MTTREQALAEAAKHHAENWASPNPLSDEAKDALAHAYTVGATWEAQRSAVLLEALEKIATSSMLVRGAEMADTARAALEKYRGEPWTG